MQMAITGEEILVERLYALGLVNEVTELGDDYSATTGDARTLMPS